VHDLTNQKHRNEEGNKGNSPRAESEGEEDSGLVDHAIWRTTEPCSSLAATGAS
jgi:hypothetical protein